MNFFQKVLDYFRGPEKPQGPSLEDKLLAQELEISFLRDTIASLEVSITMMNRARVEQYNEAIKVLCAITLSHGGEYVLDSTFLDLVDDKTSLKIEKTEPEDPNCRSTRYTVLQGDDETPAEELPAGYDLEDEGGPCCPDGDCRGCQ